MGPRQEPPQAGARGPTSRWHTCPDSQSVRLLWSVSPSRQVKVYCCPQEMVYVLFTWAGEGVKSRKGRDRVARESAARCAGARGGGREAARDTGPIGRDAGQVGGPGAGLWARAWLRLLQSDPGGVHLPLTRPSDKPDASLHPGARLYGSVSPAACRRSGSISHSSQRGSCQPHICMWEGTNHVRGILRASMYHESCRPNMICPLFRTP